MGDYQQKKEALKDRALKMQFEIGEERISGEELLTRRIITEKFTKGAFYYFKLHTGQIIPVPPKLFSMFNFKKHLYHGK